MGPCKSGTRYSRPDAASTSNRGERCLLSPGRKERQSLPRGTSQDGKRLKSNNLEEYRSRSERLIASLVCCSKDPRDILWILRVKRKPIRTAQNDHVVTRIFGTTPLVGPSRPCPFRVSLMLASEALSSLSKSPNASVATRRGSSKIHSESPFSARCCVANVSLSDGESIIILKFPQPS